MTRRLVTPLLLLFGVAAPALSEQGPALAIAGAVERIATERELWPGFEPLAIPLAIFDGERTLLFRHPRPPSEFAPVAGSEPTAYAMPGRHPAVTANSSAEIGGVDTATLLADGPRASASPADLAAVALHEAFHVFQRREHPGWSANEGVLLLYPTDDAEVLAMRRLETAALGRAIAADAAGDAACWARQALAHRRQRFAAMAAEFGAYERATELNEGLASYIQLIASGRTTVEIPEGGFEAGEIRQRAYVSGPLLALLLDRLRPRWKEELEEDDGRTLAQLLDGAVDTSETGAGTDCELPAEEVAEIERTAREDAAAVGASREDRRRAFDARAGWRVVVRAAPGKPLWPQGFDPLNLERVPGGLLHTRYLKLENEAGELRMIDEEAVDLEALTEGAGAHPLFNGVRRIEVAGLDRPSVQTVEGRVTVIAAGFAAAFERAQVREEEGAVVTIELRPRP